MRRQPAIHELLQPECPREFLRLLRIQGVIRIPAVEICADGRGVGQSEAVLLQHRNQAQWTDTAPIGGRGQRNDTDQNVRVKRRG